MNDGGRLEDKAMELIQVVRSLQDELMRQSIPPLEQLRGRLILEAKMHSPMDSNGNGRFPVVVRPQTRAFLETSAASMSTSIAGLAGAILDAVVLVSYDRASGAPSSLKG